MSRRFRFALLAVLLAVAVPASRAAPPPRPVDAAMPEGEAPTPEAEADAAAKPGEATEEIPDDAPAAMAREGGEADPAAEATPGEAMEAVPGEDPEAPAASGGPRPAASSESTDPAGEPPQTEGDMPPMPRPAIERPLAREPGRPPGRLPQRVEPGFAPPGFRRPPSAEGEGASAMPAGPTDRPGGGEGAPPRRQPKPQKAAASAPAAPAEAVVGLPPLAELTRTRSRPLFVPGRRGPEVAEDLPAPSRPILAEPNDPTDVPLTVTLSGVVSGPGVALAILIDPANNAATRLKAGEDHDGWTLVEIGRTSVTFRRGEQDTVLTLKPPGATPASAGGDTPAAPHGKRPPGRPGKPAPTGEESE